VGGLVTPVWLWWRALLPLCDLTEHQEDAKLLLCQPCQLLSSADLGGQGSAGDRSHTRLRDSFAVGAGLSPLACPLYASKSPQYQCQSGLFIALLVSSQNWLVMRDLPGFNAAQATVRATLLSSWVDTGHEWVSGMSLVLTVSMSFLSRSNSPHIFNLKGIQHFGQGAEAWAPYLVLTLL
jgi:hypothetical protein